MLYLKFQLIFLSLLLSSSVFANESGSVENWSAAISVKHLNYLDENSLYIGASVNRRVLGDAYLGFSIFSRSDSEASTSFEEAALLSSYGGLSLHYNFAITEAMSVSSGILFAYGVADKFERESDVITSCDCGVSVIEPFIKLNHVFAKSVSASLVLSQVHVLGEERHFSTGAELSFLF